MFTFRALTPIGWAIAAALVLACLAALWWAAGGGARREAAEAKAGAAMAQARTGSAAEAGAILDAAHQAATQSETLTRETADAIRQAPGADQRLDPALNDAGRRGMCKRPSLRDTPNCVLLLGPRKPSR